MTTGLDDLTLASPQDEHPHPVRPDVPLWSENYAFVAYAPEAEVGLFAHVGRAPYNPDLWRGTAVALLPDGELVVAKTLGPSPDPLAPSTGSLTATCDRPFERWRLQHDGPALRTSREAASRGLIAGADADSLRFDVAFEALHPLWDLTDWMREQQWGHAHVEQAGLVRGTLSTGQAEYEFEGTGFRDHTLGPRNFANLNRTCWAHAEFPSGRVFCALRIWSPDDQVVLDRGFVYDGAAMRDATPGDLPTIHAPDGAPHAVEVHVGEERITGEVLHSIPFMLDEPNDLVLGVDLTRPATKVIVECPCRFEWDGEIGYGWLERSRRIDQL